MGQISVIISRNPGSALSANQQLAPAGDFSLYIRAYWPKAEVIDGSWTPPGVQAR